MLSRKNKPPQRRVDANLDKEQIRIISNSFRKRNKMVKLSIKTIFEEELDQRIFATSVCLKLIQDNYMLKCYFDDK